MRHAPTFMSRSVVLRVASITALLGCGSPTPDTTPSDLANASDSTATAVASSDSVVVHNCTPASLRLDRVYADAGAGQRGITYAFTNVGARQCTLSGHPRVTLLGPDGHVLVGVATREARGTYFAAAPDDSVAMLPPGMRAVFGIVFTGIPADGRPCARVTSIVIAPPAPADAAAGDTIPERLNVCGDRHVSVGPVEGGFAAVAGTYTDTLPAADAAGRVVTLRLLPDSTAVLETQFLGRGATPPVRGHWALGSDTVVVMRPFDGEQPLLWRPRGDRLVPLAWDTTAYGQVGLPLTRRY